MLNLSLRFKTALLLAGLSILSACVFARPRAFGPTPVTGALDQLLGAWNKQDAAKFTAMFTDDADFINARSGRIHGRKAISEMFAKLTGKASAKSQVSRAETDVKMVKPDVALVLTNLTLKNGASGRSEQALATVVLISAAGKWHITAFEVGPAPQAAMKRTAR